MLTFSVQGVTINSLIGLADRNMLVAGGVEKEADSIYKNAKKVLDRNGSSIDSGKERIVVATSHTHCARTTSKVDLAFYSPFYGDNVS